VTLVPQYLANRPSRDWFLCLSLRIPVTMVRVSLLMIQDIGQRKTGVIDIPERESVIRNEASPKYGSVTPMKVRSLK